MTSQAQLLIEALKRLGPFHVWHDGDRLLSFDKIPGAQVGAAYTAEVSRVEERVTIHGRPSYIGTGSDRQATEAQLDEWRAEHAAAKTLVEAKRAEKAAAADDELERALEVVRRHYGSLHSYAKRGAFQSYILGEIQRPPSDR